MQEGQSVSWSPVHFVWLAFAAPGSSAAGGRPAWVRAHDTDGWAALSELSGSSALPHPPALASVSFLSPSVFGLPAPHKGHVMEKLVMGGDRKSLGGVWPRVGR